MEINSKMKMISYLKKRVVLPAIDRALGKDLVPNFRDEYGDDGSALEFFNYACSRVAECIYTNARMEHIRDVLVFQAKGYKEEIVTNSPDLFRVPYDIMIVSYMDITIYIDIRDELDCMVSSSIGARITSTLPLYCKLRKFARGYNLITGRKTFFPLHWILGFKSLRMPEIYYHD